MKLNDLLAAQSGGAAAEPSLTVKVCAITGAPGVGKTALAVHWAHQVRDRFPDGDLYIDMHGYGPAASLTEEQALDTFLRALNVPPEAIPINLDERAALYRSLIGDKEMLILLDNVASARQVRNLLPGSRRCLALVTARSSLSSLVAREGAARVMLDVLSPGEAVQLFADIVGEERVEAEYDAASRIARLCSYLPLALRVVAERAAGHTHLSLAGLADELSSEQNRLDALASDDDDLTNVRAVFSWSYRALPPEHRRLFRTIGLHAGAEFSGAVAAALVGQSVPAVHRQLSDLAKAHLVQAVGADRYRSHDLLRAYSAERAQYEDSQRERTHAARRMFGWYLLAADNARKAILPYSQSLDLAGPANLDIPAFGDAPSAMDWYEQERLNLLAAVRQSLDLGQYDIAWKIPVVADGFFELRSYWQEWSEIHNEALGAATTIGDSLGEASARRCLGDVCWRTHNYEEAFAHYERGTVLARKIGDPWIEGFSIRGTGLVHEEMGQVDLAVPSFELAREVFDSAGIARGTGMCLLSLGKCHRAAGDLLRAARYCTDAVVVFRQLADRWSEAWGLVPLGEIDRELGRLDSAVDQLTEAVNIFDDFHDRRSTALAQAELGETYLALGDVAGARRTWTDAVDVLTEFSDPRAADIRSRLARIDAG